jgi:pSer/pThr/pTyr-binding forkhead associated (FHA) protein
MYKLTVISGSNRGSSYALQAGELSIGRQAGNTIVLQSSKVSKRHCSLTVSGDEIVLKDLGSSNGTFVNGILTKLRKIKPGDRISVGEYVFELTEASKRQAKAVPAVSGLGNMLEFPPSAGAKGMVPSSSGTAPVVGLPGIGQAVQLANQPPTDLKGKLLWYFENQVMPYFYGLSLKHEWKALCVGTLAIFVLGNLVISVQPLMEASRKTLVKETSVRARFMAKQIADINAPILAARAETKADVGMIENAEGVRLALLTDLDNRIIAPSSKLNQYLASGNEAAIAIKAKDLFRAGRETGITAELDSSTVVAVEPVKVLSPTAGRNVVVAMAIVSIDTSLSTPDLGEMGVVYSETLVLTGLLGGLLFYILYRVTLKPFQVLNEDMDKALKGDLSQVTHQFKFEELDPLWEIINSAIQRIPKSDSPGGGLGGMGDSGPTSEDYAGPLRMIGNIVKFGFVLFDSDKKIMFINPLFEEISGIRADNAIGQDISDVARDQAMGSFTNDILSRAPVGGEGVSEDFDFSGISYKIHVGVFGTSSGSAKCYVLAALRVEG